MTITATSSALTSQEVIELLRELHPDTMILVFTDPENTSGSFLTASEDATFSLVEVPEPGARSEPLTASAAIELLERCDQDSTPTIEVVGADSVARDEFITEVTDIGTFVRTGSPTGKPLTRKEKLGSDAVDVTLNWTEIAVLSLIIVFPIVILAGPLFGHPFDLHH
ncbi:hypothetical protein ACFVAJ_19015 [Agromyces sp. NPDC057679]|uniref:hypothetical protein n=1 Tax=Agromyces sp. NPDC057679 TaxID=3346207 RepID=UPI00366DA216